MNFAYDNIISLKHTDEFDTTNTVIAPKFIDIRIQKRNNKKCHTFIEGLGEIDFKPLLKQMKKKFQTNGAILEDEEFGKIVQIQGDHREGVKQLILSEKLFMEEQIRVHGF